MRCTTTTRPLLDPAFDAAVVPVFAGGEPPAALHSEPGLPAPGVARRFGLTEAGDSCWVPAAGEGPDVLLVCVGKDADDEGGLRTAAMVAGRAVRRRRVACALASARPSDPRAATTVAESWLLGAYTFDAYRTADAPPACEELSLWHCDAAAVATGEVIGAAANRTRDLVNTPAGDLGPLDLAAHCQELAADHGFTVRLVQGQDLVDGGFGGLLGVGAGSARPPVLIEIERGRPDLPHVALVGKGITFDSGGLSIKTTSQMRTMKADMSGAASVIGALVALDRLESPVHVRAYLACAENMPGGGATRIGDVLRHRGGITTEVIDTDCEGRLVLGDALAYAAEAGPAEIIDVATLSSSTGLGPDMWAVLGNDPDIVAGLLRAGAESGEPGWELPLWEPYESRLSSGVADVRNHEPGMVSPFGAIFAALYLRRFTRGLPWAHIDLALTVMRDGDTAAWSAGANGNGTRTLARYLADRPG
ncbi:M17 family peptidase N-terminal domain-containing protein [Actinomadura sp. DC4]|uniref:leucyl aminopeptidase family protein n=1 Tax=Actinomadura sp. DC4 TaxID=3055069 RepID=UPI0025AF9501|nr:M17 family peptidase N-terminal domain-containing protein [Actinomadura sp. DC4]MDN3353637.1 M17 family peptidase N-terminal domain-containing protein [Actinomadura sp. DC4]